MLKNEQEESIVAFVVKGRKEFASLLTGFGKPHINFLVHCV